MKRHDILTFAMLTLVCSACTTDDPATSDEPPDAAPADAAADTPPAAAIRTTACAIELGHATLSASVDVAMEIGQEFRIDFSASAFDVNLTSATYDCGAWTTWRSGALVLGCRRDAGQPATQTIELGDRKAFAQQPGPTSAVATLTAMVTKHTMDANGTDHAEDVAHHVSDVTCML